MPHYQFIDPSSQEEHVMLEEVSTLVIQHFDDIFQHTSPDMQRELTLLVVRTMWDSKSRDKYGEYYGVPAPRQGPYDTGMLPPEIVLFAYPLTRDFKEKEALSKKVRIVLIHEIGHHLGLNERQLRERNVY